MTGFDWVVAPLALICFALSLVVLPIWVPLPDLIVVCAIAIVMASYDFALTAFRSRNNNRGGGPR